jgi:hypothetical protein
LDKIKSFYDVQLENFLKEIRESYNNNAYELFNLESVNNVLGVDGKIKFFCEIEKRQIEVKNLLGALTKINDNLDQKFQNAFDFSKYKKEIIFTEKLKYTLPVTIKVYEKVTKPSNHENFQNIQASFASNADDVENNDICYEKKKSRKKK